MNKTLRLLAGMTALLVAVATPAAATFGFLGIDLGFTSEDDEVALNTDIVSTDDEADSLQVSVDAMLSGEDDGDATDNLELDVLVADGDETILGDDDLLGDLDVEGVTSDGSCDVLGDLDLDVVGSTANGECGDALGDLNVDLESVNEDCDGLLDDLNVDLEGSTRDASEGNWQGLMIRVQVFLDGLFH